MKRVGHRIALFFKIGRQWLTAAPRYCGALFCGLSAIVAMIAIGYNGNEGISSQSAPVVQTSDVVPARDFAMPNESGASGAKNRLQEKSIGDPEVVEPSPVNNDSRSGQDGPSSRAIALDKSFLVANAENEKAAIRDSDENKRTAKKPVKKTQRRVSTDRDRKFSPSQEIKRAREKISRAIRRIF